MVIRMLARQHGLRAKRGAPGKKGQGIASCIKGRSAIVTATQVRCREARIAAKAQRELVLPGEP